MIHRHASIVWTGLVAALIPTTSALALHRETPGAVQISSGVPHQHPVGRSWGNDFAFASSQDLAETGNVTRQIFVFNLAYYDCAHGTTEPTTPCPPANTPYIHQITTGPGTPNNPSIAKASDSTGDQWLAFDADGSFTAGGFLAPLSGAAASKRQIYVHNAKTGEYRRITSAGDGDSVKPTVNVLAGIIAFESTAALGGFANPTHASQVYLYDRNAGSIVRVSLAGSFCGASGAEQCPSLGRSSVGAVNSNGTQIVFESASELIGDGHDTHVTQVYFARYDKPTGKVTLYRLTNGNGASRNPFIAENGNVVVFDTVATNLGPTPGPSGRRIVLADVSTPTAPQLAQITVPGVHGDCSFPTLDPDTKVGHDAQNTAVFDARVGMICTGDPLQNGTTGNRLFLVDTKDAPHLYQLTGAGDVDGPIGGNLGQWFLTLATSSDLTGAGACGAQLYAMHYNTNVVGSLQPWSPATSPGQIPTDAVHQTGSSTIGLRTFQAVPGTVAGAGSRVTVTTADGVLGFPATEAAAIGLQIGAPNAATGLAAVTVPQNRVRLPSIPVAGFGAVCFTASGDGTGTLACNGGATQGDVDLSIDHVLSDPTCTLGCREDAACQGPLPGPRTMHGQAVCNGNLVQSFGGSAAAGGTRIVIPVSMSFSVDPGLDFTFCNADDTLSVKDVPTKLYLTTGTADITIADRDAELGQTLSATVTGAPFLSCGAVRVNDLSGARLVGAVPVLDVPNLGDALFGFHLEAAATAPLGCGASCNTNDTCDDGNPCNGQEFCGVNHVCLPGTPLSCDDGDPCNGAESCDPQLGCVAGRACDDGDPCNGVETCSIQTGCQAGAPVVCDDGITCNGSETCSAAAPGLCVRTPLDCDDGDPCTDDSCDEVAGCLHVRHTHACDDGDACTTGDVCNADGICRGTLTPEAAACNAGDGNACNGAEHCDAGTGACVAGAPLNCDDGNQCTNDACDPASGCMHVANTNPCDDGNACTANDVCGNGVCTGTPLTGTTCDDGDACTGVGVIPDRCDHGTCVGGAPLVCDDGNACNGVEFCVHTDVAHPCHATSAPNCDDNNPCTTDSCDPVGGCMHVNNTAPCDDFNLCTVGDRCSNGGCMPGATRDCSDGNACNGTEACVPTLGCVAGQTPSCDDGNPCTADSCDAATGCKHEPLDGVACNDGNACTTGDVCQAGTCTGTTIVCDDGNLCNGTETCNPANGLCQAGTTVVCDDGDACTVDLPCAPTVGCQFQHVPNFVVCRLSAMIDQVRATGPKELGGKRRYTALLQRLTGARKRAQLAYLGSGARAVKNWTRTKRRVDGFTAMVQAGMSRRKIDGVRGRSLLSLATDTTTEISALVREAR